MDNEILPMGIKVLKRDGSLEDFDAEKIHEVLFWAIKDIKGVSVSDIAINAKLQIYNEIPTSDIHKLIINSAVDLISEDAPNYQFVAANLLNFFLRKEVFGTSDNLPHLLDVINRNIKLGLYDPKFLEWYTETEIDEINKLIKHNRDYSFTYAGLQQMVDKYLVQDRSTKRVFETPQYAFMLIAMSFNQGIKDSKKRLKAIKKSYNHYSNFNISAPTPILSGVRSPSRQYSSCVLADVGDNLDSIFATNHLIGTYTANRAGIGLNVGRIRSIGSKIRGGEVVHTGLIPYLKMFESTVRSCTQNGVRGGCFFKDTEVEIVDSVEIDGKEYSLNDTFNFEGENMTVKDYLTKLGKIPS